MSDHRQIEPPHMEQKDKQYRVIVMEGEEVIADETMKGLCLVGEDGHRLCEMVLNENVMTIANMFRAGSKTKHAVRLATLLDNMVSDDLSEQASEMEDMLNNLMGGGPVQ